MIIIDYKDRRPIYEQVVARFQELVLNGALPSDSQLPSVRNLAMELSINPNTIQKAYAELERRGVIYSIKGKGSFIAENNRLKEYKMQEIINNLKALVEEAKNLGLNQEELIKEVEACFREGEEHDRDQKCE